MRNEKTENFNIPLLKMGTDVNIRVWNSLNR